MIKYKTPDFECVNCSKKVPWSRWKKIYCSDYCKEEAKYIRYYRICIKEKRIKDPDVIKALRIRRAHLLSGGYSRLNRNISKELREKIIKRDKGLCRICKKPTNEIDHIKGNDDNADNLQLLCSKCHMEKTILNIKKIDENDENFFEVFLKCEDLDLRINQKKPLRICDNEVLWNKRQKEIDEERKQIFYNSLSTIIKIKKDLSQRKIAQFLNENNIPTYSGHGTWNTKNISELFKKLYCEARNCV